MNFSFLKVFLLLNWNVKKIYISYKNIYIKCIKFFLLHNALGSLLWRKLCCLFWLYNNSNIVFVERPVWAPGWRCRERSILSWLRAESWWVEAVLVCNRNSIVLLKSPFAYCSPCCIFLLIYYLFNFLDHSGHRTVWSGHRGAADQTRKEDHWWACVCEPMWVFSRTFKSPTSKFLPFGLEASFQKLEMLLLEIKYCSLTWLILLQMNNLSWRGLQTVPLTSTPWWWSCPGMQALKQENNYITACCSLSSFHSFLSCFPLTSSVIDFYSTYKSKLTCVCFLFSSLAGLPALWVGATPQLSMRRWSVKPGVWR